MNRQEKVAEDCIKAIHSIEFATGSLQDALQISIAVESIILLDMIKQARALQTQIDTLYGAINGSDES